MSFNRLNYDTCSYKQEISESVAPGEYQLGTPNISCTDCFAVDPQLIMQRVGASVAKDLPMIDIDSELLNINRKLTNCSQKEFIPKFDDKGNINNDIEQIHFNNCNIPTKENTRLSNPACNLRGTGWNRFEWLCNNPQERVLIPFDHNVSNRIVVKDNHRPLIPKPIDQSVFLPKYNNEPIKVNIAKAPSVPITSSGLNWQTADVIREY
jgi:hypothetical protein